MKKNGKWERQGVKIPVSPSELNHCTNWEKNKRRKAATTGPGKKRGEPKEVKELPNYGLLKKKVLCGSSFPKKVFAHY